jgi:hypothetical protein
MSVIVGIDPAPDAIAWVAIDTAESPPCIVGHGEGSIDQEIPRFPAGRVCIEMVASYGMPVGAEVFATCVTIGRLLEAMRDRHPQTMTRLRVKMTVCHDSRAKDANIRQALLDMYGGRDACRKGGPLHGITGDLWAALAVAIATTTIPQGDTP